MNDTTLKVPRHSHPPELIIFQELANGNSGGAVESHSSARRSVVRGIKEALHK